MHSNLTEALHHRKPPSSFKLTFFVQRRVSFGRGLYLVGNLPELGNWNPDFAVKLFWMEGDHWSQTVTFMLPANSPTEVQYKFIETDYSRIKKSDLVWEEGPNRRVIIEDNEQAPGDFGAIWSSLKMPTAALGPATALDTLARSIDCTALAAEALKPMISSCTKIEFIALQNIDYQTLRQLLPLLPYHMVYFAEDCTGIVHPILYRFTRWHLVKARTCTKDKDHLGSSATFTNGAFVFLICNGQSKEHFRSELELNREKPRNTEHCSVSPTSKKYALLFTPMGTEHWSLCRDEMICSKSMESDKKLSSPATSPPHLTNLLSISSS